MEELGEVDELLRVSMALAPPLHLISKRIVRLAGMKRPLVATAASAAMAE
jgi:hypothetical protein